MMSSVLKKVIRPSAASETPDEVERIRPLTTNEAEWKQLVQQRKGLEVIQSHGRQDPILPFVGAQWLRDMLVEAGLNVDFIEFVRFPVEVR